MIQCCYRKKPKLNQLYLHWTQNPLKKNREDKTLCYRNKPVNSAGICTKKNSNDLMSCVAHVISCHCVLYSVFHVNCWSHHKIKFLKNSALCISFCTVTCVQILHAILQISLNIAKIKNLSKKSYYYVFKENGIYVFFIIFWLLLVHL